MRSLLSRTALVVLGVLALAGTAIAVNVLLLRYADSRSDPVGKLTPRATITQPGTSAPPSGTTGDSGHDHGHDTTVEEPDD
jgi:hypothetical protein